MSPRDLLALADAADRTPVEPLSSIERWAAILCIGAPTFLTLYIIVRSAVWLWWGR